MLECVVNVSEGRDVATLARLVESARPCLLDVHRDPDHHRAVLTLAGRAGPLEAAVRALACATVAHVDLRTHHGAHPRIGALDVVPWVSLAGPPVTDGPLGPALAARDRFAAWAAARLGLGCYLYGPGRTLPEIRRAARAGVPPDIGPRRSHPTAGSVAVGARPLLVAYNVWLAEPDLDLARAVAAELRSPAVRALGLRLGGSVQVSCNLVDPFHVGPAAVFDAVAGRAQPARGELVGLVPAPVLEAVPEHRWVELDLSPDRTIEARLEEAGVHW